MAAADVAAVVEAALRAAELEYERLADNAFGVSLPGVARLRTPCRLSISEQSMTVQAFVMRRPDENHAAVYGWLLRHNPRMYAVAWALDDAGDIYLTGKIALAAIDADEIDRVLGAVLEYSDGSFNSLLRLGFGSAIRREWAWRVENGESLANLAAFADLAEGAD